MVTDLNMSGMDKFAFLLGFSPIERKAFGKK